MLTSDLVTLLRLDIGDTAGEMLGDEYLTRCVTRAVYVLNKDAGTSFAVNSGEVTPDPSGEEQELLLLRAHINVCSLMRSITANAFSFQSGDKHVDKTKQPSFWADLQGDLEKDYKDRVKKAGTDGNGDVVDDPDNGIMTTPSLKPVIYDRGIEEDENAALGS
jgi:hypothetical protein